ncbi:hypothetical protein ACF3OE_04920 [Capnocytophaga canis]|uniref:hypothetical protein n=1 Tax=Capnocytophaga canis TaxID=1848903 RepID=UPI00370DD9EA
MGAPQGQSKSQKTNKITTTLLGFALQRLRRGGRPQERSGFPKKTATESSEAERSGGFLMETAKRLRNLDAQPIKAVRSPLKKTATELT